MFTRRRQRDLLADPRQCLLDGDNEIYFLPQTMFTRRRQRDLLPTPTVHTAFTKRRQQNRKKWAAPGSTC